MTEQEAVAIVKSISYEYKKKNKPFGEEALNMAIKALEKQIELRENCEGSCSDCKYRGNSCANDLLIG